MATRRDELQQKMLDLDTELKKTYNEMGLILLETIQTLTTYKLKMGRVDKNSIEFNFDRGKEDNFGLEFRLYWNDYHNYIEITHSCGLSASKDYMEAIRPLIKERDIIIGKLWGFETLITRWFATIKEITRANDDLILAVGKEIDKLDYEEMKSIRNRLVVGARIKRYNANCDETIKKVDRVYLHTTYNNEWHTPARHTIAELVYAIFKGNVELYDNKD